MNNQKLYQSIFVILFFFVIIYLLHSDIVGKFIWKGETLFGDFKTIISWLECNYLGFDVYNLEDMKNCPSYVSVLFYGHLWLNIPFNENLKFFYLDYLPYITIFLFFISITFIINPKSLLEYFVLILALLNPSTVLLFERLGFDIFVFLSVVFITFNSFYIINWFTIFCLTFIKIYPAILGINIFIENIDRSFKKNLLIIFLLIMISAVYSYVNYDKYMISIIDGGLNTGKAGYHYLFSLNSLPKIFKYILNFNYILLLIIFYSSFVLLTKFFYKKIDIDDLKITKNSFLISGKLFTLGAGITLFCYVAFSNYAYREVFILLLLPHIIFLKKENINNLLNILFFLIIIRFLFLFPYSYINIHDGIKHIDSARIFSEKFIIAITIKSILDFVVISLSTSILFLHIKNFFRYRKIIANK